MDCTPVDRAVAWEVAAVAAASATAHELNNLKPHVTIISEGTSWVGVEQEIQKSKVEVRSILVRDLPRHLGVEESADALRTLFSEASATLDIASDVPKDSHNRKSKIWPPPVATRESLPPQSSRPNDHRNGNESLRGTAAQKSALLSQKRELLKQLPHAVSSIRVATGQHGGSTYAFVDFSDEILASTAFQLLGHSVYLPGTLSQVQLSLHETWSSPVVVDQYHVYIAGLPPGSTAEQVEALVRAATGATPTHVKMSSVAGIPSRRGVREYAFLRFPDDDAADEALKKLENAAASLHMMVRRVYKHRRRGIPTEPLSHAANCSIFIANLPPLTNSEELREICSYFHLVPAAEVHPTKNYGFVRLASHEAALAAITHLHGTKLHGRTLSCAWSSRSLALNDEEPRDDAWERAEEAYAVMSSQCMDFEEPVIQQTSVRKGELASKLSASSKAKKAAAEVAGEVFWLSFLAKDGPVSISDIRCQWKQCQQLANYKQARLQQWYAQEWEECIDESPSEDARARPFEE